MKNENGVKWGLVSTIKAPAPDILNFAAYHLDLGAHRLFIYLDDPDPVAFAALKAHPKIRVKTCDPAYWKQLNTWRPAKHQVRQCLNATNAYGKARDVDWLAHIDVDEFIFSSNDLTDCLDAISADTPTARMRPVEALAGDPDHYKAFIPNGPRRNQIVDRIYPEFGRYLRGGFLSHVAGKIFLRTGLSDIEFRIHSAARQDDLIREDLELDQVVLCHRHAPSWEIWRAHFAYRHDKGAYRADLPPARGSEPAQINLHQMLASVLENAGEVGLRTFFEETALATPTLLETLEAHGLLLRCDLALDEKREKHFPEHADIVA